MEVPYGTVLSALQNVVTRKQQASEGGYLSCNLASPALHAIHLQASYAMFASPSYTRPDCHNKNIRREHDLLCPAGDPEILDEEPLPPEVPAEKIVRDPGQAYLAICLGVKDQNEDLREWIQYHQSIGVGKFYVFDDSSSVPAAEGLQDLIQEGEQKPGQHKCGHACH